MLFTKNLKPNLNIQADPLRALLLFFSNGLAFITHCYFDVFIESATCKYIFWLSIDKDV